MGKRINPGKPLPHPVDLDVLSRLVANSEESAQIPEGFETPCWTWNGATDKNGYGQIKVRGVARWIHRIAVELFKGRIPDGNDVDHLCGNTSCWNPEHLKPETVAVNRGRRRPVCAS